MADQNPPANTKGKKYRVNVRAAYKNPNMVTLVPTDLTQKLIGPTTPVVSVALGTKDIKRILPATTERPEMEMISTVATQDQLRWLYEVERNPLIEEFEE